MARFSTKNMTPTELKALKKDLTASHKELLGSVKLGAKALADAAKVRDTAVGEATKVHKAATKVFDDATKAAVKAHDAFKKNAEKEALKLTVQIQAHETKMAQVEEALKAPATTESAAA